MQIKILIITIILVLSHFIGMAGAKEYINPKQEIILKTSEGTLHAWILGKNKRINPKLDRFYYGYYMKGIFCKQGELQGKPLNGKFQRYDIMYNILESGNFKSGLKIGLWKQLSSDGSLSETTEYRKGMLCGRRVIYENGKPNILERYRAGKLIGKPKYRTPLVVQKKGVNKISKIKKMFQRLIKSEYKKSSDELDPKNQKIEGGL